jgi:MFS family permease
MNAQSQFALLRERRFAPFFWTQFLGAANDNIFKNAFVVFVTFEAARGMAIDSGMIVNLIGALFILPFMIFSATSGQLADKYEKSRMIRWIKLFEIAIMLMGLAGFMLPSIALLFATLALLGVHSTLFGPVKYAILPQHLSMRELVGGNGLVESGTFVAILLGTIAGGLVVAIKPNGTLLAGALSIAVAILGWLASRRIPVTPAVEPQLVINWNPVTETWRNLKIAQENVVVWRSMLGISARQGPHQVAQKFTSTTLPR